MILAKNFGNEQQALGKFAANKTCRFIKILATAVGVLRRNSTEIGYFSHHLYKRLTHTIQLLTHFP
jgi:hypothetical protein